MNTFKIALVVFLLLCGIVHVHAVGVKMSAPQLALEMSGFSPDMNVVFSVSPDGKWAVYRPWDGKGLLLVKNLMNKKSYSFNQEGIGGIFILPMSRPNNFTLLWTSDSKYFFPTSNVIGSSGLQSGGDSKLEYKDIVPAMYMDFSGKNPRMVYQYKYVGEQYGKVYTPKANDAFALPSDDLYKSVGTGKVSVADLSHGKQLACKMRYLGYDGIGHPVEYDSPDHKLVAFFKPQYIKFKNGSQEYSVEMSQMGSLYVMDVVGKQEKLIAKNVTNGYVVWSTNAKTLYYNQNKKTAFTYINKDGVVDMSVLKKLSKAELEKEMKSMQSDSAQSQWMKVVVIK